MSARPLNQQAQICVRMQGREFALPEQLVTAIVLVESSGQQYAWNPEPHYRYLWDVVRDRPFRELTAAEILAEKPPSDFPVLTGDRDAEWWGQQASWGPMQVMGAVAREHGFRGHFPALCDLYIGIRFGCMHLDRLRRRFHQAHGWEGVVAAYNAGSPRRAPVSSNLWVNQDYVDKVAKHVDLGSLS